MCSDAKCNDGAVHAKDIALFGIFRSGTNFTRTVLEWNYHCRLIYNMYGWKHGFYPIIVTRSTLRYPSVNTLFVTKNPFSSIFSLFKYFRLNGKNIIAATEWKHFLRQRFIIHDSFQPHSPQYRFSNVVEFWNNLNWNYASLLDSKITSVHVRYEDLLENPAATAEGIAERLELQPRFSSLDEFRVPTEVTMRMSDRKNRSFEDYLTDIPFDKTAYSGKLYYRYFDISDIHFIMDNLDMELIRKLGYDTEISRVRQMLK